MTLHDLVFTHWMWWILGIVLLIGEIAAPGVFFLWVAIASGITGIVVWLAPAMSPEWQGLLFAVLAVVSTVIGRRWFRDLGDEGRPGVTLNTGGGRHVGRIVPVTQAIRMGKGRVRLGDTEWLAEGPDAPEGAEVRIVGADGPVLVVEPVAPAADGGSKGEA